MNLVLLGTTARSRLSGDARPQDAAGHCRIPMVDFTVAMRHALDLPQHSRRRFTVGY